MLKKEGTGSPVVLLLAERARSEGARSTRAIEDRPSHPLEIVGKTAAALLAERRVLARQGWAGEKVAFLSILQDRVLLPERCKPADSQRADIAFP